MPAAKETGMRWVRTTSILGCAALAIGLAACSNGGGRASGGGEGSAAGGSGSTSTRQATVAVANGDLGRMLVDGQGRTLYMFLADKGGSSTCYGDCAANWPALTVSGRPTAGDGVEASMLGTTKRTDGSTQVTFDGHPLYTFSGDSAAGQTNGQGVGDVWFVVSPDGAPIKGSGASAGYGGKY